MVGKTGCMCVAQHHLWLAKPKLPDKERVPLLGIPISPSQEWPKCLKEDREAHINVSASKPFLLSQAPQLGCPPKKTGSDRLHLLVGGGTYVLSPTEEFLESNTMVVRSTSNSRWSSPPKRSSHPGDFDYRHNPTGMGSSLEPVRGLWCIVRTINNSSHQCSGAQGGSPCTPALPPNMY